MPLMGHPSAHAKHSHHYLRHLFGSEIDLTSGSLAGKMLLYTVPIVALSLLQLLYSSVDEIVVSYYGGGYSSMNAIGSNSALINLLIGLFVGTSVGSNVVVAKAVGQKDQKTAQNALESSILLAFISGIFIGALGAGIAPYLLIAMQTPASILPKATDYLRIYFAGMPFLLVFNFGSAILRALGDSKRPLYALASCGAINVALNFLFVITFQLDVAGVALTTLISEFLEAVLILIFLSSKREKFIRLNLRKIRFHKEELLAVLKSGIPAGLQSFVFSVSNVFIQASVNSYSDALWSSEVAMTGNTASQQIEGYIYIILDAFSVATTAVVAQNYGARKKENLKKALFLGVGYVAGFGFLVGLTCFLLRDTLNGLFISKESFTNNGVFDSDSYQKALDVANLRLSIIGLTYFLDGIMEIFGSYCRGLGHSKTPTIVIFLSCTCLRLIYILAFWNNFEAIHTLPWLWCTWPVSWVVANIAFLFIVPRYHKKALEEIDKESASLPSTKEEPAKSLS